jgi:hypothetical protein
MGDDFVQAWCAARSTTWRTVARASNVEVIG